MNPEPLNLEPLNDYLFFSLVADSFAQIRYCLRLSFNHIAAVTLPGGNIFINTAIAFNQLGLRRGDVIGRTHYQQLSELVGYKMTGYTNEGDGGGGKEGDVLLSMNTLSRNKKISIEEQWRNMDSDFSLPTVQMFSKTYGVAV